MGLPAASTFPPFFLWQAPLDRSSGLTARLLAWCVNDLGRIATFPFVLRGLLYTTYFLVTVGLETLRVSRPLLAILAVFIASYVPCASRC
jgi:hypothetical protein